MPRRAILSIAAVVGALALIVAIALVVARPWESRAPEPGASVATEATIAESTHLLSDAGEGSPVVVEFLDYECPSCGQLHPVVHDLVDEYGDRVTFAVRHFPLPGHPSAIPAALAVEAAAQQDAFERMHETVFERQREWSGADDPAATLRGYAEELGLDMAAFDAAIADDATMERVSFDANAGMELGVRSTPSFFVDGELLVLQRVDDLRAAVEAALAE